MTSARSMKSAKRWPSANTDLRASSWAWSRARPLRSGAVKRSAWRKPRPNANQEGKRKENARLQFVPGVDNEAADRRYAGQGLIVVDRRVSSHGCVVGHHGAKNHRAPGHRDGRFGRINGAGQVGGPRQRDRGITWQSKI